MSCAGLYHAHHSKLACQICYKSITCTLWPNFQSDAAVSVLASHDMIYLSLSIHCLAFTMYRVPVLFFQDYINL